MRVSKGVWGGEDGVSRSKGGSRSGRELWFTADSRGTIVFSSNVAKGITNRVVASNDEATIRAFEAMKNRERSITSITGGW